MAALVSARCAQHEKAAAVEVCIRCGTFLCSECLELFGDEPYCLRCLELVTRTPESARSVVAAALSGAAAWLGGVLFLFGTLQLAASRGTFFFGVAVPFLVPGLFGFALGRSERERLLRGEVPPRSAVYANAAVLLGTLDLALLVLALAGAAYGLLR